MALEMESSVTSAPVRVNYSSGAQWQNRNLPPHGLVGGRALCLQSQICSGTRSRKRRKGILSFHSRHPSHLQQLRGIGDERLSYSSVKLSTTSQPERGSQQCCRNGEDGSPPADSRPHCPNHLRNAERSRIGNNERPPQRFLRSDQQEQRAQQVLQRQQGALRTK